MKNTWVLNSNASIAKVYELHKGEDNQKTLLLLKELHHEDSRKKRRELVTDGWGRYSPSGTQGKHTPHSDPKDTEAEHFAIELAHFLNQARADEKMKSLILIAAPRFSGLLQKHFSESLQRTILLHIQKDYHEIPEKELTDIIASQIKSNR